MKSEASLCSGWSSPFLARASCLVAIMFLVLCVMLCGCGQEPATGEPCTMLVYLCGSNLETQEGLASANLDELLKARIPADMNVVVQTGGARRWHGHGISSKGIQRYEVSDHELVMVEELADASMGDASTFADFVEWGVQSYPANRTMLVLWDHGGKSAEAICFDEKHDFDGLDRAELKEAFDEVGLEQKLDYLVFDACFMSSLENAVLLDDYADYLIASQEVIPSRGLDYRELPRDFAVLRGEELGRSICDKYLAKCEAGESGDMAELSLLDLSATSAAVDSLSAYCDQLVEVQKKAGGTTKVAGAARLSALYGSASAANLMDASVFCDSTQLFDLDAKPDDFSEAYDALVAYRVQGRITDSEGISLFYPFEYDADEIAEYVRSCPIKGYARLLKGLFLDEPEEVLVLEDSGSIDKDGTFCVRVAEEDANHVSFVRFEASMQSGRGSGGYVLLGEGCDVRTSDGKRYASAFEGKWPALHGELLLTKAFQVLPHSVAYAAPVEVNGVRTYYMSVYQYDDVYADGQYVAGHIWEGYDENDIPSKDYVPLRPGDKVATLKALDDAGEHLAAHKEVAVAADATEGEANAVDDIGLPTGIYRYRIVFTDVWGREVASDYAVYEVSGGVCELVGIDHE